MHPRICTRVPLAVCECASFEVYYWIARNTLMGSSRLIPTHTVTAHRYCEKLMSPPFIDVHSQGSELPILGHSNNRKLSSICIHMRRLVTRQRHSIRCLPRVASTEHQGTLVMEHVRNPSPAAMFKATSSVITSVYEVSLTACSSSRLALSNGILPCYEENGIEHIINMSLRIIGRYEVVRIMACPYLCIVVQQSQGSGARSVYRV